MSIQQPPRNAHLGQHGAGSGRMSAFDDGNELHPIIRRAALATASQWVDALVVRADADGHVSLVRLDDGAPESRWHHDDLSGVLTPGTPVALHSVYGVLALGDSLVSVRAA